MRRCLIVAGLLMVMVGLMAAPAYADRRKPTIEVGVDPDGVAIQIDTTVSGAGRSHSGTGGGGIPCQYALASVSGSGLYAGQPADVGLFTVTCGSHVDVRYLRVGPNGQPLAAGATVDPFQLALSARDRLPLPAGQLAANPTRSLVGLPTWFWYAGYDGRPLTRTVTAFGITVEVEARPTRYRWDFGDGTTMTSRDLGRPYPAPSSITHTYQTARPGATVSCTFEFAVRWRTPGGAWTALPALSRTATTTLPVAESQAVLGQ